MVSNNLLLIDSLSYYSYYFHFLSVDRHYSYMLLTSSDPHIKDMPNFLIIVMIVEMMITIKSAILLVSGVRTSPETFF